ncbi:unnamed protein product [marine sediment metagenome]|uniref:Uncharacterized protein n=1 Tax=marine sediment metagenome TaxID=412755 RepID=X1VIJ1_9ZZZZ
MISVNADWERGYAAGYSAAHRTDVRDLTTDRGMVAPVEKAQKPKRKASAYSIRYGKMFKRVAPKYKLKNGSWAKDGFKRAGKEARRLAKK